MYSRLSFLSFLTSTCFLTGCDKPKGKEQSKWAACTTKISLSHLSRASLNVEGCNILTSSELSLQALVKLLKQFKLNQRSCQINVTMLSDQPKIKDWTNYTKSNSPKLLTFFTVILAPNISWRWHFRHGQGLSNRQSMLAQSHQACFYKTGPSSFSRTL